MYILKISILILRFQYISKNIDIDFDISIYIKIISISVLSFQYDIKNIDIDF